MRTSPRKAGLNEIVIPWLSRTRALSRAAISNWSETSSRAWPNGPGPVGRSVDLTASRTTAPSMERRSREHDGISRFRQRRMRSGCSPCDDPAANHRWPPGAAPRRSPDHRRRHSLWREPRNPTAFGGNHARNGRQPAPWVCRDSLRLPWCRSCARCWRVRPDRELKEDNVPPDGGGVRRVPVRALIGVTASPIAAPTTQRNALEGKFAAVRTLGNTACIDATAWAPGAANFDGDRLPTEHSILGQVVIVGGKFLPHRGNSASTKQAADNSASVAQHLASMRDMFSKIAYSQVRRPGGIPRLGRGSNRSLKPAS